MNLRRKLGIGISQYSLYVSIENGHPNVTSGRLSLLFISNEVEEHLEKTPPLFLLLGKIGYNFFVVYVAHILTAFAR